MCYCGRWLLAITYELIVGDYKDIVNTVIQIFNKIIAGYISAQCRQLRWDLYLFRKVKLGENVAGTGNARKPRTDFGKRAKKCRSMSRAKITLEYDQKGYYIMLDFLLLFEYLNKIRCLFQFVRGQYKNSKFWSKSPVGKENLIGHINDIVSYAILYNSIYVLNKKLLRLNVIERVSFVSEEVKCNAGRHFETLEKCIHLALYTWIIIELVAIKVAKFRSIPF